MIASSLHNHAASESERCRRVGHRYEREYESERAAVGKRKREGEEERGREKKRERDSHSAQNRRRRARLKSEEICRCRLGDEEEMSARDALGTARQSRRGGESEKRQAESMRARQKWQDGSFGT